MQMVARDARSANFHSMLRDTEIEAVAYREIERVRMGAKPEDSRVELKLSLPDPRSAAWQIAGLCNAAPGDDAVWVVGFGEDGSFEPPSTELAEWEPAMKKHFDEVSPITRSFNVSYENHPLTLFHFLARNRPYVVPMKDGNKVVPWRGLNNTRGAHRREILTLFGPDTSKPLLHILKAHVTRERPNGPFILGMTIYVVPKDGTRIILPFYKCSAYLKVGDAMIWLPTQILAWSANGSSGDPQAPQIIFREPTFLSLAARHYQPNYQDPLPQSLTMVVQLGYADMEGSAVSVDLPQTNLATEVQHFEWRERGWFGR